MTPQELETVASFVPPLPKTPIIDLRTSDLGGPSLANRQSTTTTPGNIFGRTSAVGPYHESGPGGKLSAKRLQLTADAFGVHSFLNRVLPAGTYTFAVKVKGAAAQTVLFGHLQSSYVSTAITTSWQQLSVTFTLATDTVARLLLGHDGSPVDLVYDELQLYEGSSVPPFAETPDGHLRQEHCLTDLLTDGDALDADTALRAFIPLANYPGETTFTAGTMFVMFRTDDDSSSPKPLISTAGSGTGWHISAVAGRVTGSPAEGWSNPGDDRYVAGTGWHCAASRFDATGATVFLDGMRMKHKEAVIPAQTCQVLGAFSFPPMAGLAFGTYPFEGQCSAVVVYDRALTDWEVNRATRNIVTQHNTYQNAPSEPLKVWIAMGDSITTGANIVGGSYYHHVFDGAKDGWLGANLATSGQGIRYDRWEDCERMVIAAREQGHRAVVSIFHGANDTLSQDDFDEFQRRWTQMRTMGAGTIVFTVLPRDLPGWEAMRLAFNDWIREAHANGQFDAIVDVGADAVMGNPGSIPGPEWYDHTHPSAAGHAIIATLTEPVLDTF